MEGELTQVAEQKPTPHQLPTLRRRALRARDDYRETIVQSYQMASFSRPADRATAERYWAAERQTLREADLYHVTDEMSRLSVMAGATLGDIHLRPWDAPCKTGLMWFDHPIGDSAPQRGMDGTRLPFRAVSWNAEPSPAPANLDPHIWVDERGQVWVFYLTFYTWSGDWKPAVPHWLHIDDEIMQPCGDSRIHNPAATNRSLRGAAMVVLAAWMLMAQQIADVVDLGAVPAAKIKPGRRPKREPARPSVKVVRIAPRIERGASPATHQYHHRWLVRGHWRNQWHPKQRRHVPIWIMPHIKGPADAPLLDRQEVVRSW